MHSVSTAPPSRYLTSIIQGETSRPPGVVSEDAFGGRHGGGGRWQPSPSPGAVEDRASAGGSRAPGRQLSPPALPPRERSRRTDDRQGRRQAPASSSSSRVSKSPRRFGSPVVRWPPPTQPGMGVMPRPSRRELAVPIHQGMGTLSASAARGMGSGTLALDAAVRGSTGAGRSGPPSGAGSLAVL